MDSSSTTSTVDKYKFISGPDDSLTCLICHGVAEEPWQHDTCGRLFCNECLERWGKENFCAYCKDEQPHYFKDNRSKRDIRALPVKCDNVERGCEWVGTVATLEEHVATCEFTLLPCPKRCEDGDYKMREFMRKDLDEHMKECPNRDHTCETCGEKGTFTHMTQDHDEECKMKVIPCPNAECTDTMQRQQVEEHVSSVCEFSIMPCKFKRLGCETELKRKYMVTHEEDDKLHLHMAINMTAKLENEYHDKLENACDKIAKLEKAVVKLGSVYKLGMSSFASFTTRIHEGDYLMKFRVTKCPDALNVKVILVSHYAATIALNFTVLNQLEDKNHYQIASVTDEIDIPYSLLGHDQEMNTHYLKDDSVYFRVLLEVSKPWLSVSKPWLSMAKLV